MARKKTIIAAQQIDSPQASKTDESRSDQSEYERHFADLLELGRHRMEELLKKDIVLLSHEPIRWLSLAEAERLSGINRGTLSKAIKKGTLASNGAKGKGRVKISAAAFVRWLTEQTQKAERQESDAHVEKLMAKAGKSMHKAP